MSRHFTHHRFIEFLEGSLSADQNALVNNHIAECEECRLYCIKLKEMLDSIDAEKSTDYDSFMFTRIQAVLENQWQVRNPSFKRKLLQPALLIVSIVMMVITGIYFGNRLNYNQSITNDYQTEIYYLSEVNDDILLN
jgi:predicted anti-sigma-YlaC factor YlaD